MPLWIAAAACLGACVALGAYVRVHSVPALDLLASRLRGQGTPLAAFFTRLGRWYAIVLIGLLAAAAAHNAGSGVLLLELLASQILAQGVISRAKLFFSRARPERWLLKLEPDLSYPSGHSATGVVFFVPLAYLAWHVTFVPPLVADGIGAALAICAVGLPWSRMALGAHYATDVIGGLLFGTGWLCATVALVTR